MSARSPKTPEDRAEVVERAASRAKKSYKTNTKKRRAITDEELVVINDMLVSLKLVGYSNTQCAAIVGISKGQVTKAVTNPNFQRRLTALQKKLPEAAIQLGAAFLVESVMAVMHVLRTEKDNALVLKAAAEMFDRFGIPKMTRSEHKIENPNPSGTEMPTEVMDKLRLAPPEVQAQAADLHEMFTEAVTRLLDQPGGTDGE